MIRDLGLVKGGKGLRHNEVALELRWRGLFLLLKPWPREVDGRCMDRRRGRAPEFVGLFRCCRAMLQT